MKFKIKFAEQIVGLFVLLAVLSLAGILIFMGINQRWFAKDYSFVSKFISGEGLNRGMSVSLKGFTIGAVDQIELLEDNTVQIRFHIYDTYYDRVRPNSVLELSTSPIGIGGGGLKIHPGISSEEPLAEGSYIPSTDFPEGKILAAQGLAIGLDKEDAISSVVNRIGPILDSTHATIKSLNSTLSTIDNTLKGDQEGPLMDIMKETYSVLAALDESLQNLGGITAHIEEMSAELTETQGLVKKLLDPKGSVALLLDDEELYRNIVGIMSELEKSVAEISSFAGYVNSQQPNITALLKEGEATMDESQAVMEGLQNNPLLRGGISEKPAEPATFRGMRPGEY
jgi:phospholipid/cholesterol/gamma-HCH transport system substrate-binding protein